ncbi:MAG: RluA family pseudouridine synthase [Treponema sp.]|nr:RluA family pseudouridine synthase [Treponema sp.]MBQ6056165.1 RluA family pseudouridine synthase [Treponema sp.]
MNFLEFEVTKNDENRRLDKIIRKFIPELSLSELFKAIRSGIIKVDNKKQKGEYKVLAGQKIQIADFLYSKKIESAPSHQNIPPNIPPIDENSIILRNDDLLFLNKKYNLAVQESEKNTLSLAKIVEFDYENVHKSEHLKSLSFKTGPLHRLDKKTTGLICFSQSLSGAQWFSKIIREHKIVKTYLAVTLGKIAAPQKWQEKIQKSSETKNGFHTVNVTSADSDSKDAKDSLTEVFPVAYGKYEGKDVTLAKFIIHTGRTHQIRATSAFHGYPLLGDDAYRGGKINSSRDFYLHAYSLEFTETPQFNLPQKIICPPDSDFVEFLNKSLIKLPSEL